MANFHPSENLLVEHSAGTLDWGVSIMVAAHISMCPECQAKLRTLECLGGAMMSSSKSSSVGLNSFDQVMARIHTLGEKNLETSSLDPKTACAEYQQGADAQIDVHSYIEPEKHTQNCNYDDFSSGVELNTPTEHSLHDIADTDATAGYTQIPYSQYSNSQYPKPAVEKLPVIVRKLLPKDKKLSWKRVSSSLTESQLTTNQDKYKICFHKIKRGGKVVEHDHRGIEITVVLNGSFSDEAGTYRPGDFIVRQPGSIHRPMATQNEDCLCLSLTDSPVKVTGLLGRIVNPFLSFRPA